MSSSWYKDFTKRQELINSRIGVTRTGSISLLSSLPGQVVPLKEDTNSIGGRMKSLGMGALDIISRPGYMTGGFLNETLKGALGKPSDIPLQAAIEGFQGKRKEFFQPMEIIDPKTETDPGYENAARFVVDFLASVASDPTTFIPGTALTKVYKGGAKLVGLDKAAEALSKYKNLNPKGLNNAGNQVDKAQLDVFDALWDAQRAANEGSPIFKPTSTLNTPAADIPGGVFDPATVGKVTEQAPPASVVDEAVASTQPPVGPNTFGDGSYPIPLDELVNPAPKTNSLIESILNDQNNTIKKAGYLDNPVTRDFAERKKIDWRARPTGADKNTVELGGLVFLRSIMADNLANIRGKYFSAGKIENPWKEELVKQAPVEPVRPPILDEIVTPPKPKIEEVAQTADGISAVESARLNAVKRHYIDNPSTIKLKGDEIGRGAEISKGRKLKNRDVYDPVENKFYYNGEEVDFSQWAKDSGLLTDEGFTKWATVSDEGTKIQRRVTIHPLDQSSPFYRNSKNSELARRNGTAMLPVEQYARMLLEKPNKAMDTIEIKKHGRGVPFNEYVASRQAKWNARNAAANGEKVTREIPPSAEEIAAYNARVQEQAAAKAAYDAQRLAYEEAVAFPDVKRVPPTREEKLAWVAAHSEDIPPADLNKLAKAMEKGDEAAFLKTVDRLMKMEKKLDLTTLDELGDAVKEGRVSKEELAKVLDSLGAKNLSEAKTKLQRIEKRIEELRGETANLNRNVYDNLPPKIRANAKAVVEAMKSPPKQRIPSPKIKAGDLRNMRIKRDSIERQRFMHKTYDEVIQHVVDPNVYNALSPASIDRLGKHLSSILDSQWSTPSKWKHRTGGGAKAETPNPYDGGGRRWEREYNQYSQYTFWKGLVSDVSNEAKAKGLKGPAAAIYKREQILPVLKAEEDLIRAYGVHPSLAPGGKGLPLSWFDVISSMGDKAQLRYIFNYGRQITQEQMFDIASAAIHYGDNVSEEALSAFRQEVRDILENGKRFDPATDKYPSSAIGAADQAGHNALSKRLKKGHTQLHAERAAKETYDKVLNETLDDIANADFIVAINQKLAENSARIGLQRGEFVQKFTNETLAKFLSAASSVTTQDELFGLVENARKGILGTVKREADIAPPPGSVADIEDAVEASTKNFGTELASVTTHNYGKAKSLGEMNDVTVKHGNSIDDWVKENVINNPADRHMVEVLNLSDGVEYGFMGRFIHAMFPHLQEGQLRNLYINGQNYARIASEKYTKALSNFEGQFGKELGVQVFNDIRKGLPLSTPAHEEMAKLIGSIFDVMQTGYGPFNRTGLHPNHINSNLRHFKVDKNFELKGKTIREAYESWKSWGEVKDPLDLLSRYHAAMQKTLMERDFGSRLSSTFGSKTLIKDEKGRDYVRIAAPTGGSRMAHLVDKRMYYPREIAENIKALDKTLNELAKPGTSNPIVRIFDFLTHKLKTGLTIYRLGHHMRNMYGDVWLTAMDGIVNPKYYHTAWDIMTKGARVNAWDDELKRTVTDLSRFDGTSGVAARIRGPKGETINLSHDDVYRLILKNGGLPGYSTLEDLGVGTTMVGDMEKVQGKTSLKEPFAGKAHRAAVGLSEFRDHYVRVAHFLGLIERKGALKGSRAANETYQQFTERLLNDMSQEFASRIRKYHPDGSDLTLFERNIAKRGILFYAWIRKAIPFVIQQYFTQPGRFLMFPKAMYGLAEANGIDLNGFTDPFPTDQLFPAWFGPSQGPVFGDASQGYIGMRAGVPQMDIIDQYLSSPGETFQSIASAANPAFRVPVEMFYGETAQGVPIKDTGKYLLGQVPFGNLTNTTVGAITGDNPIGDPSPSDVGYDPGGIRDPAMLAWINTLTGLGLIDMSKPSYIKSGEFDVKYGRTEAR